MDKTGVSGTSDPGSIPGGATKKRKNEREDRNEIEDEEKVVS